MNQVQERRFLQSQIRSDPAQKQKVLHGLAARFQALSSDLGGFKERLAPGCFADSLASGWDVAMLWNHDLSKPLGRQSNGSLTLKETTEGLGFRCILNDSVSHASDVYQMCLRGDVRECSFGFACEADSWADEPDPEDRAGRKTIPVRTVRKAKLFEISAVTYPAYADGATSVTASVVDSPTAAMTMAATAGGRCLWPAGEPPPEIRFHVRNLVAVPQPGDDELLRRARQLLTRTAMDS